MKCTDKNDLTILLEIYRQAACDRRLFVRVLFAVIFCFLCLMLVIGIGMFMSDWAWGREIAVYGLVLSGLGWTLAEYLSRLISQQHKRLKGCEKLMGIVEYFMPDTDPSDEAGIYRLMQVFFVLMMCAWLGVLIHSYF